MIENLTLLQINDTHAYLENRQTLLWNGTTAVDKEVGGYARITALIKDIKAEKNNQVLVLDNGDSIHGTFAVVNSNKGRAVESVLNKMTINAYDEKSNKLLFAPYLIKEYGGLKVGIIGIAATNIDRVMPDWFSDDTYFTIGKEELPHYIDELKNEEQVDLVVVLSHLGFPQEAKLAEEIDGIDVLLCDHTHNRVCKPSLFNDTIIIQSGYQGSFLGRLDLEIDNKKVVDFRHQMLTVEKSITGNEIIKDDKSEFRKNISS